MVRCSYTFACFLDSLVYKSDYERSFVMKKILSIFLVILFIFVLSLSLCADEDIEQVEEVTEIGDGLSPENPEGSGVSGSFDWFSLLPSPDDLPLVVKSSDLDDQLTTTQIDSSFSSSDIVLYDSSYGGVWSSAVSDYFEGYVLTNSPFEHYFVVRQNQYVYDLYCGNIKFQNGYYTGNNLTHVSYNTQNTQYNDYISVTNGVSLNYLGGDGIFYSDLEGGAAYASVSVVRFVCVLGVVLVVMLIVRLFGRFFK